jgi:hypothetical protein
MGLEGLVSSGWPVEALHWINVKNRKHPAMGAATGWWCGGYRSNFNYIVYEACTLTEYDPLRLSRWIT